MSGTPRATQNTLPPTRKKRERRRTAGSVTEMAQVKWTGNKGDPLGFGAAFVEHLTKLPLPLSASTTIILPPFFSRSAKNSRFLGDVRNTSTAIRVITYGQLTLYQEFSPQSLPNTSRILPHYFAELPMQRYRLILQQLRL